MGTASIHGLGVAVATPFNAEGNVDLDVLDDHIDFLVNNGADFLVALGTTAETPTLSEHERYQVAQHILYHAKGLPVVYGLGGNCTRAIINQLHKDKDFLSPFHSILSVTPFYNKPSQRGLYEHFAALADNSSLPIILYNVPGRTGVNMSPDTTLKLATDFPGKIIAVKEASGSLDAIKDIIARAPHGFQLFSGDDNTAHETIKAGGAGVISVAGNAFPELMHQLVRLSASPSSWQQAQAIHSRMATMDKLLFRDGNPSGIKCALSLMPHSRWLPLLRLPLVEVTEETRQEMKHELPNLL